MLLFDFSICMYACTYVYVYVYSHHGFPQLKVLSKLIEYFNPLIDVYRKQGKTCWAKLLRFSHFWPPNFFHEYKDLSIILLDNKHLWPRQCESISVKTLMAMKPQIFSPVNLSLSTVYCECSIRAYWTTITLHDVCTCTCVCIPNYQ